MTDLTSLLACAIILALTILNVLEPQHRAIRLTLSLIALTAALLMFQPDFGVPLAVPIDPAITRPFTRGLTFLAITACFGIAIYKFVSDFRRASAARRAAEG